MLPEPEVKIATRSVFYDELGKRVRTKKEIPGEDGQIREGCIVIKKGEAYEKHLFTAKDEVFKNELFLDEAKQFYTALINRHIHDPERRLKVFDPNSVYLPTKKIGKNNPKEAEIEADIRQSKDLLVRKTADDASGFDFLRRCTSLSLFDDGREVLDGSVLAFDVAASRITCGTGCPQSVLVGIGRRNDAVRGHENRSVEGLELLLLLPPCVSIVPCKVIVLFECRIIPAREDAHSIPASFRICFGFPHRRT